MKLTLSVTIVALLSGGCATFSPLPLEARHIRRVGESSARVYVWKPVLKFQSGTFIVRGAVQKRVCGESTLGTRLQVVLYDAAGNKLRENWLDFSPAELPSQQGRRPRTGSYVETLGPLPPGTTRIEVRARDADHPPGG